MDINGKYTDCPDEAFAEQFRRISRQAYESAVQAGIPVTIVEDGAIYRIHKIDGRITRRKVKELGTSDQKEITEKISIIR